MRSQNDGQRIEICVNKMCGIGNSFRLWHGMGQSQEWEKQILNEFNHFACSMKGFSRWMSLRTTFNRLWRTRKSFRCQLIEKIMNLVFWYWFDGRVMIEEELTIRTTNDEVHIVLPVAVLMTPIFRLILKCIGSGICRSYDIHRKPSYFDGLIICFKKGKTFNELSNDFISIFFFFKISK